MRREACEPDDSERVKNTRPSTCELVQLTNSGKCSSKKSVFRRCNLAARERKPVTLKADFYRFSLIRTEAIRLPALELILWSSY